ncbi:Hypothetical predicted protein [Paramuricea clavata]|uniref:Uncharacterized protein n=1 Tax=Paramuricea clavata TaxID=317549 RepID=A0A6S7GUK2_PARCT|nr:Hypothetical predicted protein [Paramuricea clavata]
MSSIVTGILSSTVGLLWNKVRDSTAAKLKEGDVTDAKIREIVVTEMNDIKTKLDCLSRKELLTSYVFLQEGVDFLNASLNKSRGKRGETSGMPSSIQSGILNETIELSHAVGKMKICSDTDFEVAKKRFENARRKAAEAFVNDALSTEDRIFAAKLRVVSEILEHLESPETAITGCLSFLQRLHDLPAIREMFSVHVSRGVLSRLNKAERVKNVKSVMFINYVLFQFNFKFSRKLAHRLTWPGTGIELGDRSFNPILDWREISSRKSWGEKLILPCNELVVDKEIDLFLSAVNSHGDMIFGEVLEDKIKVICKTGKNKVVGLPGPREGKLIDQGTAGLAVDNNNNIHVVKRLEIRTGNGDVKRLCALNVLDNNYKVTHDCALDFLGEATVLDWVNVAINKNNNIILIKHADPNVYVCDNTGHLKRKFKRDSCRIPSLSISEQNQIITPSDDHKAVYMFTEKGNLQSTMKLPEGHWFRGVAFHHVIGKIAVLSYVKQKNSYFLLCYSETGELDTSTFFNMGTTSSEEYDSYMTSHPSGPVVVVGKKSITFI